MASAGGGAGHGPVSQEDVAHLQAIAGCSEDQARFLLEAAGGNMDMAVHMFLEQTQGHTDMERPDQQAQAATAAAPRPAVGATQQVPPRPRAPGQAAPATASRPVGLVGHALRLPFYVLRTSFGLFTTALAISFGIAAFMGDRVLPRPIMRAARGVAAAVTGTAEEQDPDAQARGFIQRFRSSYGERHPRWVESSARQATITARAEHKFLFVYLHAPEHQNTDVFCRSVLCSQELVAFTDAQFVSWGGDIRQPDAYALSTRLGATSFPFVALLAMNPDNKVGLVMAAQGEAVLAPGRLHGLLMHAVAEQGAMLVAARAEMQEREMNRRLLEEQNREYEESLAADRERERAREEARRKAEEEARAREEEEARERAAREAEEKKKRDAAAAIASRREAKRAVLASLPEPAAGTTGAANVRVRLPDGSNAQRSFPPGSTVGALFDFVDSLDSTNYWTYSLVSNYPRKVFSQQEAEVLGQTLEAAGLTPQAALFVQPGDEDG